jgi:hypothetical protein
MRGPTIALLALCAGGAAAAAPLDPSQLAILRDAAREALKPNCGKCHDSKLRSAKPAALKHFDLKEADWSARLTTEQLGHFSGRFESFEVSSSQRSIIQTYLDAEKARRAASPPGTPAASR